MDRQTPVDEDVQLAGESERGARARAMLESAIFQEVLGAIEASILDRWKSAPIRDSEGQLALRLKWQIMQEIRRYLADVATTGRLAEQQIEAKAEVAKRRRAAEKR